MAVRSVLEQWARDVGLALDDGMWARLQGLVELWARYGAAFNLVGDTHAAALTEHVREGLMALRVAEMAGWSSGRWLDIGSGAGIPGLVIAVVRGNVVLVEPRERRAAFLSLACAQLNISQFAVIRAKVVGKTWEKMVPTEELEQQLHGIGVASAKAVMAVDQWIETASGLVPRGIVVCHVTKSTVGTLSRPALAQLAHGERVVVAVRGG